MTEIARIAIANDGSGDERHGNYRYAMEYEPIMGDGKRRISGRLKRWDRTRGALLLLKRVLEDERI